MRDFSKNNADEYLKLLQVELDLADESVQRYKRVSSELSHAGGAGMDKLRDEYSREVAWLRSEIVSLTGKLDVAVAAKERAEDESRAAKTEIEKLERTIMDLARARAGIF